MTRPLDLICLGRAAVDLYGEQLGAPLEDVSTFKKSLGGCAANIAVGTARLGLKSAMLTRVGDEHMGRFVRTQLQREGVDVSHVKTDKERLTALVLLSIKDRETFPLIFYRENCADMALAPEDFSPEFIGSAEALLVTGTHFSRGTAKVASDQAMKLARAAGTKVVLDIDYRPVLWGLAGHGRGEDRYVAAKKVSWTFQSVLPQCDLVVGTEEEIRIAGGDENTFASLRAIRKLTRAPIVMKLGAKGCAVFEEDIPDWLDDATLIPGFPVEVLNVLGAGDAFLSGFLRGWIRGEPIETAGRYGNAAGALVVTRHGCSPEMPSMDELLAFARRSSEGLKRPDDDPEVKRLHHVIRRQGARDELMVLAFDHRAQLEAMADKEGAQRARLGPLKSLIAQAGYSAAERLGFLPKLGLICDDRYGAEALAKWTGQNVWIARPVEVPQVGKARPQLAFESGPEVGLRLRSWPQEHVIKCLVHLNPDALDAEVGQLERMLQLQQAAAETGNAVLFEVIPFQGGAKMDAARLPGILDWLYGRGVKPDWWKLPPLPTSSAWGELEQVVQKNDPHCCGVLLLGLEASEEVLAELFRIAAPTALVKGFAVGRTLFAAASSDWLAGRIGDEQLVEQVTAAFGRLAQAWRKVRP
jgi:5-dehydro-2-deoxygluconokinase